MVKLTEKQKRFADYYIELGNATQAAIKAGYAKRSAQQMGAENLSKPVIKTYIDKRLSEIASERIMSAQEILERLSLIANAKITETVVIGTPMGVDTIEKPPDFKTQIQAMKELIKRYPDNDRLLEQQIRKLTADADLAEFKADTIKSISENKDDSILIIDAWSDGDE